jgi:hypothetical protein
MRRIVMTARGPLIFSSSQRSKLGSVLPKGRAWRGWVWAALLLVIVVATLRKSAVLAGSSGPQAFERCFARELGVGISTVQRVAAA